MAPPRVDHDEVDEPLAMSWTIGRVLIVLAMLAMVGFWAWIFSGGPKQENRDRLVDRAFVTRTEARCQNLAVDLAALPNAATITSAAQRAEVLDQANEMVAAMVAAIEADAPESGGDAESVAGWITDWKTYVTNREDYADRLRQDPNARLLLDASPLGDSVDRTIEIFADVNDMPDCATPGDVG